MNILIIEDDEMLRKALCHRFIDLKHAVSACSNGQEGIELVQKNRQIDLIICDVMMPVLTGPTFILMLRKYFPQKLPVIIVISVVKDGESFLQKIDIPHDYFLPKPIDFDKLQDIVSKVAATLGT